MRTAECGRCHQNLGMFSEQEPNVAKHVYLNRITISLKKTQL